MYSVRFSNCRYVYPLQIVRPIGKFRVDAQAYLDQFLTDVCSNECIIHSFVRDSQKRSTARASKGHSAYFPCEYCMSKGHLLKNLDSSIVSKGKNLQKQKNDILAKLSVAKDNGNETEIQSLTSMLSSVNEAIKSLNTKHNKIVWPACTINGEPRTTQNVNEIVAKIENDDVLSLDEAKGIVGRSLFLDIPYFTFVFDIPAEYLHSTCLGVVKKVIELTFNVGESRQRNTTRKLSLASDFNKLMAEILVVREFSRRARCLDFAVMKGQEFRNIILFFFVLVIQCIPPQYKKERRLWLLLAYMIRMCILPNNEYQNLDPEVVKYCGSHFYKLYEHLFHARNCTYNTHVVSSHMPEMRVHGPLTLTSAFGFESFYGELRHSFTPGTRSPLKQVFEKILMKRSIAPHSCKQPIHYSPKDTPMESNSLIYTFHDKKYNFFKIISMDDENMECLKVGKYETSFPETPTLDWAAVGVFKAGGISDNIVTVCKENIAGKVIKVQDLFITCPINVLEEK